MQIFHKKNPSDGGIRVLTFLSSHTMTGAEGVGTMLGFLPRWLPGFFGPFPPPLWIRRLTNYNMFVRVRCNNSLRETQLLCKVK
jgi:hypothetical protein